MTLLESVTETLTAATNTRDKVAALYNRVKALDNIKQLRFIVDGSSYFNLRQSDYQRDFISQFGTEMTNDVNKVIQEHISKYIQKASEAILAEQEALAASLKPSS